MSGFVGLSLINISIFAVFCWSLVNSHYIRFDLRRGTLAAGSLVGSLVGSSVSSLISSSIGSLVSSSSGSSLGFSGSGCRYNFIIVVLKLVGPLVNYTLYVSPLI